jgi:transcriptional regulator with XRE-family HTH domain
MFEHLGPALRLLREQADLSQTRLAREAGMSKSQLSKYEKGRELPKLDSLARILRALDVQPLWLFYIAGMLGNPGPGDPLPTHALLQAGTSPFLQPEEEAGFRNLFDQLLGFYRRSIEARVLAAARMPSAAPPGTAASCAPSGRSRDW